MTELRFHGRARDAAVWLLTETGLDRHPTFSPYTYDGGGSLVVTVVSDPYELDGDFEFVLDVLRSLSTQGYQLDLKTLAAADGHTRWACLHAVATALDVDPAPWRCVS